jgi:hypothetical protein
MKRFLFALVLVLSATAVFAAPVDFSAFEPGFNKFVQSLATNAPFNASTGLTWSQASLGQFPHFGIGLTVGATTVPAAAVTTMVNALGISLPSEFSYFSKIGIPVPAYTIDARIGGFVLPFDIGLKVGYIPASALQKAGSSVAADFLLAGGDVRFTILKDQGFVPALSIGVGYTYLQETVSVAGLMSSGITIANVYDGSVYHTLSMSNPSLQVQSQTNVLEAKLQLSKQILFLTPYLGAAAAFSFGSTASGSVQSTLLYDGGPINQTQIDQITAYYIAQGQTPPSFSSMGFTAHASAPVGMDYRIYGGLSFDIIVVSIDLGAAYDISNNSFGASANLRLTL